MCDHTYLCAHISSPAGSASHRENHRRIVVAENILQVFIFSKKESWPQSSPAVQCCSPLLPPFLSGVVASAAVGTKPATELLPCCKGCLSPPGLPARDPGLPEEAHGFRLHAAGHRHRLHGSYVCSFTFWPREAGS